MTKIQLRRDTAANWTTNNPTPASGEPCFETDTGKFKIGDGATAYNNLPYQGDSGTIPTNMVTIDTDQTITGKKVFLQPNSSNKGLNVALGSNATNPDISVHIGKASNSDFTGGMIRFDSTNPAVVGLQQQNNGGTIKISSGGDLINYAKGTTEIRNGATWSTSKSGIRIPANSKSEPKIEIVGGSNTVGSSAGVDAKISVGHEGSGTWANRKGVFIETSATTNASDSGAKLWLGEVNYRSAIYHVPDATVGRCLNFETNVGNNSNAKLSIQKSDVVYTGSDGVAHSLITSGGVNTDLSNLSDTGKILMSEMGMPSEKYIDLALGTSGSTYTAPANGWIKLAKVASGDKQYLGLFINNVITFNMVGWNNMETAFICPVLKGDIFKVQYSYGGTTNIFRFYYAKGSESEA